MQQDGDPRSDLPGAASPPIAGRRWAWVKVCAWAGAVVVLLCAAAVATWLVSRVQRALVDRPESPAPERMIVEAPPVVVTPQPAPAPVSVPADVETVVVEQAPAEPSSPPAAAETERRRPLLMQH